jgi:hypothetical protein
MYLSSKLQNKKSSNKSYKKVLEDRLIRQKNRIDYSVKILNLIKEYSSLADPLLLDVAEKHIINAYNSLEHEKRIVTTTEDRMAINYEVFENEVIADLFDLFFMGQAWRVAESICIKGGAPKICRLMDSVDIEIKSLGKSIKERGAFYQLPIRNSVKMQLESILIIAEALKNKDG